MNLRDLPDVPDVLATPCPIPVLMLNPAEDDEKYWFLNKLEAKFGAADSIE